MIQIIIHLAWAKRNLDHMHISQWTEWLLKRHGRKSHIYLRSLYPSLLKIQQMVHSSLSNGISQFAWARPCFCSSNVCWLHQSLVHAGMVLCLHGASPRRWNVHPSVLALRLDYLNTESESVERSSKGSLVVLIVTWQVLCISQGCPRYTKPTSKPSILSAM